MSCEVSMTTDLFKGLFNQILLKVKMKTENDQKF